MGGGDKCNVCIDSTVLKPSDIIFFSKIKYWYLKISHSHLFISVTYIQDGGRGPFEIEPPAERLFFKMVCYLLLVSGLYWSMFGLLAF